MKQKISIGDLVCYNCAGMRKQTLGLVVDLHPNSRCILIQWAIVGKYMPRRQHNEYLNLDVIKSGSLTWHELGDWWEVMNDKVA
jgi:hypothetical protein